MSNVERLVTVIDLDDRDTRDHSIRARHEAALGDGRRFVLLDDRGWSSSAGVDGCTRADVEGTARMVVGPDEPWGDQTREQAEEAHWTYLEQKLQNAGISVQEGKLETLSHDVEMSDRLRSRLVDFASS
jgi:hypothetical protein